MKGTIPFTIVSRKMAYLALPLTNLGGACILKIRNHCFKKLWRTHVNGETNNVHRFEPTALVKLSILTKLIHRFHAILIQIPPKAFVNTDKLILVFVRKNTDPRTANASWTRRKWEESLYLSLGFLCGCVNRGTEGLVEGQTHRSTGQKREPKIDRHRYAPLISDKGAKPIRWRSRLFNKESWGRYPPRGKKKLASTFLYT